MRGRSTSVSYKSLLSKALPVVSFATTAFGGLLLNIAPPVQTEKKLGVGLAGFVLLFVLLAVTSLAEGPVRRWSKVAWLCAGLILFATFLGSFLLYTHQLRLHTYEFPLNSGAIRLRGSLDPRCEELRSRQSQRTARSR